VAIHAERDDNTLTTKCHTVDQSRYSPYLPGKCTSPVG